MKVGFATENPARIWFFPAYVCVKNAQRTAKYEFPENILRKLKFYGCQFGCHKVK